MIGNSQGSVSYRLRLFLAVDLQNSTALKFRFFCEGMSYWRSFLAGFYREFATVFLESLDGIGKKPGVGSLVPVQIWKSSGDEVVMVVDLRHRRHLKYYLKAFRDGVRRYNATLAEKDPEIFRVGGETLRMRLKPRAWLADFPINNMEFSTPHGTLERSDDNKMPWSLEIPDYFGPAMDVGFRLGSLATSRKFVLSVETVWALVGEEDETIKDFRLFMEGRVPLKGVRGGESYPVFWLDLEKEIPDEDAWTGLRPFASNTDYEKIEKLCRGFIGMDKNPLLRPIFIDDEKLPPAFSDTMYRIQEV
ncbi:MAG: hypothetical protein HQL75_02365 [Magnetococcales bacterium]|nr:hypothetical protein [Magnetococcales bacterium]